MTDTPPDWVLIEAAKRSGWGCTIEWTRGEYSAFGNGPFRALCDMIQKYEQPPVDRKLLCAREAWRLHDEELDSVTISVRAIELWIEGYGE
jgi:methenyltetrahydromethanopterin cyclohydrolase